MKSILNLKIRSLKESLKGKELKRKSKMKRKVPLKKLLIRISMEFRILKTIEFSIPRQDSKMGIKVMYTGRIIQ